MRANADSAFTPRYVHFMPRPRTRRPTRRDTLREMINAMWVQRMAAVAQGERTAETIVVVELDGAGCRKGEN